MQLLVIRHGIAEDKDTFARSGKDDSQRPLTAEGEREMALVAKGLKATAREIDVLASSPLVRARQTAAIVAGAYRIQRIEEIDALAPDAEPDALLPWLRGRGDREVVAVVGHEPHLGRLVAWLLTGQTEMSVVLKKGGACRVDFASRPACGEGELRWLMTSAQLQRIGA